VGAGHDAGTTGAWIAAPQHQAVPITFSDGTELTLMQSARARVLDVDATGATIIVERGELHASVVPGQKARWQIFVGPFQVRVTGTRFDVGWHPEAERFSLTLREGSVTVAGPGMGTGRSVHAGETLSISRREGELSVLQRDAVDAAELSAANTGGKAAVEPPPPPPVQLRPVVKNTRLREADFRELARQSKYGEALATAERAGFDHICQTAGVNDVMLLADTARLAGDADRARQAYHVVRQRFTGRDASQAAFFLGRLAFDQSADYAEAARYFALSIAEQPKGPLAREAAGRLIEAKVLLADAPGARAAAHDYLNRYPDGPHAKTARRLLSAP
jgi:hypothetical protein